MQFVIYEAILGSVELIGGQTTTNAVLPSRDFFPEIVEKKSGGLSPEYLNRMNVFVLYVELSHGKLNRRVSLAVYLWRESYGSTRYIEKRGVGDIYFAWFRKDNCFIFIKITLL